jgi:mannan endo-1,4-beta-mannosidase
LRRFLIALALAVLAGAGLVFIALNRGSHGSGPGSHLNPLPQGATRITDPLASGTKVALGVNLADSTLAAINGFADLIGVRPRIIMWYQQWSDPLFYPDQLEAVAAAGATPMVTWDPSLNGAGIPLSQIADGRYDSYIRASAEAAAAWKHRLYIRFAHEMNLPGSPFGPGRDGNTPATFIAAWRHVVTIFRQASATNVEWVWSPNDDCEGKCPFTSFYPGDVWVDWVSLDGYNYSSLGNDPWLTFAQIFGPSYAVLTHMTSKPLMIGETGSVEDGGSKAEWITDMGHDFATQFKRVRGVIWFQRVKEADWRVNSSSQSLAAFRSLVGSPLFDINMH